VRILQFAFILSTEQLIMAKTPKNSTGSKKTVESLKHDEATRKNIPTAEYQSVMRKAEEDPVRVAYERRNRDLDPQLVWRGKDEQDWSDFVVQVPPLYIQEKVHPKVLIDDLLRQSKESRKATEAQPDLFADFNGIPEGVDKTEFYQHDQNWSNRMILGDSLSVMASLAEREGLRGKVQCIYLDPPYGIKFNSNFQWSTTSRDVKDGSVGHITREPEQVKAFRDTWRDGIHSYLTYLRDRLTVARDLLAESGSVCVQIGDENMHRVRALLDEILGPTNHIATIAFKTSIGLGAQFIDRVYDHVLWFAKNAEAAKYRPLYLSLERGEKGATRYNYANLPDGTFRSLTAEERDDTMQFPDGTRFFTDQGLTSRRQSTEQERFPVEYEGKPYPLAVGTWRTTRTGMARVVKANRIIATQRQIRFRKYFDDFGSLALTNFWDDAGGGIQSRSDPKIYVVQTNTKVIERCLLMTTDQGDLVLDPTCGSGTTAYVAEQWGRRWITIDTSRVALALARARIMGARYPYYLLADSRDGQMKEAEVTRTVPLSQPVHGSIRQGFVYERVPHITLKSIANNAEIDVIWEKWQAKLEPLREELPKAIGQDLQDGQDIQSARGKKRGNQAHPENPVNPVNPVHPVRKPFEEWEIPRQRPEHWPLITDPLITEFWQARIARQKEIDASIAAKAEFEYLYDKPYDDRKKVRVAGPFTVESLSPHRVLGVDENDELIDHVAQPGADYAAKQTFPQMILENLKIAGVQQAHKEDRITFTALTPWPGDLICAEGRFRQDEQDSQDIQKNPVHPVNPGKKLSCAEGRFRQDEQDSQDVQNHPVHPVIPVNSGDPSHPVHPVNPVEKRAAIFIGPEFGTVTRPDLVSAAREAGDAGFDVLIACAFNYEAHTTEFNKLGRLPVLKARMNADLHMADDLKNTGKGNLFVIFGEPDITILPEKDGKLRVKVNGVDVFHPNTGEVRSDGPEGIACWFIDTDYNEESFFVRHAYFLGANDPYGALKTTLKAEINEDAWATLHSDTSRPFAKPKSGRIAVKVINHLGDEVMKVFRAD
jgi:adenine-specific DNA-methyltransferase